MPLSYGTTNAAPYATAPAVGPAGSTYYNTTSKNLFLSDGTQWNPVASGSGSTAYTQVLTTPTVVGSPYLINHNLNFHTPLVQIWDNVTGNLVSAQVSSTSANQVTVTFGQNSPNNVTVVVSTGGMGVPGPAGPYSTPPYVTTISAPTAAGSPYTITHNLSFANPLVQTWDAVTGAQIMAVVTSINLNQVTVSFTTNPPNNVTVVCSTGGMGPPAPSATAAYTTTITAPTVAGSPYTITHALGTPTPLVELWDAVTGLLIFAQVRVVNVNQIAVTFSAQPANNVTVVVSAGSMGPPGPAGPPGATYNLSYYQSIPAPTTASSPYSIPHNLNSTYVHVQIWDSITGQLVQMQVTIVDANHVNLSTAQNMPNAVNVVVIAGPAAPIPVIPANWATKAYVDAKTATLPPPVLSGSGVQSFTDVLGDVWVAAVGVNGGNWRRARDVLHARVSRIAALTTVAATATRLPFDTLAPTVGGVSGDPYGMATLGTSFAFTIPIAGYWRVGAQVHLQGVGTAGRSYMQRVGGSQIANAVYGDGTQAASSMGYLQGAEDMYCAAADVVYFQYYTAVAQAVFAGGAGGDTFAYLTYLGTG
jgi:hypothetical protein